MLPGELARDMEPSSHQFSEPINRLSHILHGRVRATKDTNDSGSHTDSSSGEGARGNASHSLMFIKGKAGSFNDSDDKKSEEQTSESDASIQAPTSESTISFGALVKAQDSLGKRKRSNDSDSNANSHGSLAKKKLLPDLVSDETIERRAGKMATRDFLRTSKHAPAELSSRKAVSRKREVVPTQKINHRDPRFEPYGGVIDESISKRNYSFLDAYRNSEISELKLAIRKTNDGEFKEQLKSALLKMETRKEAHKTKEQQQEVLRKHRKEEKEKIEQGKRPFFLKKADQRKMLLIERFESMNTKQVDKVILGRRKKKAAKERKAMPGTRKS